MDTNQVILECLKALSAGAGADEKIAVLESMIAGNRHAYENEVEIIKKDAKKPNEKKAK